MSKSKRSHKSRTWRNKQNKDIYVKKSREQGFRSRAAFKLLEINEKDHILKPGMMVVDLGSAPGGWSQVAKDAVTEAGRVVAIDVLEMHPIPEVYFINGDITSDDVFNELLDYVSKESAKGVDVVISDMAPNITGNATVDQARSAYLVELAYDFAQQVLVKGGVFLAKIFQGSLQERLVRGIQPNFKKVVIRKPKSSRTESKEVYLLAISYNK